MSNLNVNLLVKLAQAFKIFAIRALLVIIYQEINVCVILLKIIIEC